MKIYVAHTYGRTPENDYPEDPGPAGESRGMVETHGDIVLSRHTTYEGAQLTCEQEFQVVAKVSGTDTWRRDVIVWHPSRNRGSRGEGCPTLWSLLPEAAPAMNDANTSFYPQMRETSYWVEELDVIEDEGAAASVLAGMKPGEKLVMSKDAGPLPPLPPEPETKDPEEKGEPEPGPK